jgi:hypothetical protein
MPVENLPGGGQRLRLVNDPKDPAFCLTNQASKQEGGFYTFTDPVNGKMNCATGEIFLQSQKLVNPLERNEFIYHANEAFSRGDVDWPTREIINRRDRCYPPATWLGQGQGGQLSLGEQVQLQINVEKRQQSNTVNAWVNYCGDNRLPIVAVKENVQVDPEWYGDKNILGNSLGAVSRMRHSANAPPLPLANAMFFVQATYQNSYSQRPHETPPQNMNMHFQPDNSGGNARHAPHQYQQARQQHYQQVAHQPQPSVETYYSNGRNQRILYSEGKILGIQIKDPKAPDVPASWKKAHIDEDTRPLFEKFLDTKHLTVEVYPSRDGIQRIVHSEGRILGLQYRDQNADPNIPSSWKDTTAPGRMQGLIDKFNTVQQQQMNQDTPRVPGRP